MKKADLSIITPENKIKYTVEIPESDQEEENGLAGRKELPEKHGMLYIFKRATIVGMMTSQTEIPVDFIFISGAGDIIKIVHNAEPLSNTIYECDNCKAVLEINGGECKKFGIQEEDSILHPVFILSSDNTYPFHRFMFKKLTSRTMHTINYKDIAFLLTTEQERMGWPASSQIFVKKDNAVEKYMITQLYNIQTDVLTSFFPPYKIYKKSLSASKPVTSDKCNWSYYPLGCGSHLYIRNDLFKQFKNELKKRHIKDLADVYSNCCRIAYNILTDKSDQPASHSGNCWNKQKYWGIDTANIGKVLNPAWWKTLEWDGFISMLDSGDYLKICVQNSEESVLDIGIKNCQNKEIVETLKYIKENNWWTI